jgi:hypothetical protein
VRKKWKSFSVEGHGISKTQIFECDLNTKEIKSCGFAFCNAEKFSEIMGNKTLFNVSIIVQLNARVDGNFKERTIIDMEIFNCFLNEYCRFFELECSFYIKQY